MVKCRKAQDDGHKEPTPWKLHRCRIVHPEKETLIDDGLAVYFRGELSLQKTCALLNKASLL
jgi:tRNA modification GTPase